MSMILAARVWHLKLDKTTMLLLMAMCDSANDDGTGCLASEEFLMWKTGVARATFYRVRAALEARQIIRRHTLADGRVETLIALDNAPKKGEWKRPKRGGARAHKKGENTIKGSHGEIKGSHGETTLSHGETDTDRAEPESVSDGGAFLRPIHPIEPSYYPSSLANTGENAAAIATETAPPERRTRERLDLSALKRDPLIIALAACFGREPATRREWEQWRLAVNDLHTAGATADDIPRAIRGYQTAFPDSRMITPFALVKHWSEIQGGTPHAIRQHEITRRTLDAENRERDALKRAEQERRAREAAEVERYMREHGLGARA